MPPFWSGSTSWNQATGERLGPYFDLFVGTEGRVSDLYAAYVTHGARRIFLTPGATLSADLTIAANDVVIFSPHHPRAASIVLGAKKLTITGQQVMLTGFKLSGAGAGIEVNSSGDVWFERIAVENATSHGIYLNGAQNSARLIDCYLASNGGDGLRITSGVNHVKASMCDMISNTGYGVNDLSNASILVCNRIAGNTAGQINGTPSVNTGNKVT